MNSIGIDARSRFPAAGRSGIFSLFESFAFARKRPHPPEPLACLVAPILVFVFCHGLDY